MQQLLIISGRSGAGKTTVAHALEDLGYFVVDNLPPQLLDDLLLLTNKSKEKIERVAIIADVRETEFLRALPKKWHEIDETKYIKSLIYLEACDQKLIDRYQETKRRHPLDEGVGIRAALAEETILLEPIRALATKVISTDQLNSHELRNLIKQEVGEKNGHLNLTLLSFGFKYGVPSELDLCFDVRFLKNPYYQLPLRAKSGLDCEVSDYVLSLPDARVFLDKLVDMVEFLYPHYQEEGKSNLTIAIGCTGGRHRSVTLVEALFGRIKDKIDHIRVEHRDLARHT
jgi:UPF0042 nucleotide-binding protein